ncbi:interleukin-15-like isoform X2 [Heptranchias perlo]|uniref:interleukin-15-like isoform X2 n=1 Tax=Heptranchias perlo TaxID=212740 RepID=UPI00355A2DB6
MNPLFRILALTLSRLSLMQFALFIQRSQVKRVCFYCYLHLSLDCHIFTFRNTETGISLLLLCLAVCLPKAGAADHCNASKMKTAELNEILKIVISMQAQVGDKYKNRSFLYTSEDVPELLLYTPEDVPGHCFETAVQCFSTEVKVLEFEFKLDFGDELKHVSIMRRNIPRIHCRKNCTICEEFQEKNATDFLKAFEALLQKKNKGL